MSIGDSHHNTFDQLLQQQEVSQTSQKQMKGTKKGDDLSQSVLQSEEHRKTEEAKKQGAQRSSKANTQSSIEKTAGDLEETSTGKGVSDSLTTLAKASGEPVEKFPTGDGGKKPALPMTQEQLIDVEELSIKSAKGINLIAIMANVMVLQAKSNQDFFSSLWEEASASMNMEAQLAPVVAKATLQAGLAQAEATKNEANEALASGITNLVLFGATAGISGYAAYAEYGADEGAEGEEELSDTGQDTVTQETTEGVEETEVVAENVTEDTTQQTENAADNAARKSAERAKQAGQKAEDADVAETETQTAETSSQNLKSKLAKGFSKSHPVLNAVNKAGMIGMTMGMLAQGVTGIITYTFKNKIAGYQVQAAQWQAVEKMGDIEVQFFGQAFGRAEGMSQQAQQNINQAMQILEGIVQTITQTVNSGFQSI